MNNYFKNNSENNTPIPKAMWWYILEIKYKDAVTADYCNKLYNNELKDFFKKYPDELYNACHLNFYGQSDITDEEMKFFRKEIFSD